MSLELVLLGLAGLMILDAFLLLLKKEKGELGVWRLFGAGLIALAAAITLTPIPTLWDRPISPQGVWRMVYAEWVVFLGWTPAVYFIADVFLRNFTQNTVRNLAITMFLALLWIAGVLYILRQVPLPWQDLFEILAFADFLVTALTVLGIVLVKTRTSPAKSNLGGV